MAVSSDKDFWIHPNALSITLNYFGDPQLIQTSVLAGAVIMAYKKDIIDYDAAHNFREWKLQAFPTQLNDTCKYYVHAELARDGNTAMIIYSPTKRDIEGRIRISEGLTPEDDVWGGEVSTTSYFIYLGELSYSVDFDGDSVDRVWNDGLRTGTLATDQHRMEEAQGEWALMFRLNTATGLIDFLKTVSSAIFNRLTIASEFIFGENTFTNVATIADSEDKDKHSDSTLPTSGYVAERIKALDRHFLIKDENSHQSVGGSVGFEDDVTVYGKHLVENEAEIKGDATIGNTLNLQGDMKTDTFNEVAGQITGAQLTQAGILTVAGLKAMSFEVFELIYNKIRAVDGKMALSSTGVVERVEYVLLDQSAITPEEFYTYGSGYEIADIDYIYLTFKEDDFNKGILPFTHCDILYGYVNQIGESGQYARGGQCCMYVLSTNEEIGDANAEQNGQRKMTIKVKLFAEPSTDENGKFLYDSDNQVVGNIPPTEGMTLAHRGNTRGDIYRDRTTSFFIDSMSGNIIMLQNVTTPRIHKGYYGATLGTLPTDMYESVKEKFPFLQPHDPVMYAKYGIFENILEYDHQGQPIRREVYRGTWRASVAQGLIDGEEQYRFTDRVYHTVTHKGSLWRCGADKTTVEPAPNIAEWTMLVEKGKDSDMGMVSYTIIPNTNTIYYDEGEGKMSVDSIRITIGETTPHGYVEINDQVILDDRNLSMWYSLDGGEHIPFSISDDSVFELEDGSGILVSENDIALSLEGDDLDAANIHNDIKLYLKNEDEATLTMCTVAVLRAGSFKSTVFTRSATPLTADDTPRGGTYTNPIPDAEESGREWHDGIPAGTEPIYASTRIFYGSDRDSASPTEWSEPQCMVDNPDFKTIYNDNEEKPNIEGGFDNSDGWLEKASSDGWYDEPTKTSNPKWMATNSRKSGTAWTDNWVITQVKGENGQDALKLVASLQSLPITCDAQTGAIIGACSYEFDVFLTDGDGIKSLISTEGLSLSFTHPNIISSNYREAGNKWIATVVVDSDSKRDELPASISIILYKDGNINIGIVRIPFTISERGMVGPQGEVGAMPAMKGYYESGKTYHMDRDATGRITAKPCVYHKDNRVYYILKKDYDSQYQEPSKGQPDTNYWDMSQDFEIITTSMIMANWAKFGSNDGGEFYDKFLFSRAGVNNSGKPVSIDTPMDNPDDSYRDRVFKDYNWDVDNDAPIDPDKGPDYDFTGEFIPKYSVNLKDGHVRMSTLCEAFINAENYPRNEYGNIQLNPAYGVNISFPTGMLGVEEIGNTPSEYVNYRRFNEIVILPTDDELKTEYYQVGNTLFPYVNKANGMNITITTQYSIDYLNAHKHDLRTNTQNGTDVKPFNTFILVCADKGIYNTNGADDVPYPQMGLADDTGSFLVYRGTLCKYLLMPPGFSLKLKLDKSGGRNYWHVENSYEYSYFNVLMFCQLYDNNKSATNDKDVIVKYSEPILFSVGAEDLGANNANMQHGSTCVGFLLPRKAYEYCYMPEIQDHNEKAGYEHIIRRPMGLLLRKKRDGEGWANWRYEVRYLGNLGYPYPTPGNGDIPTTLEKANSDPWIWESVYTTSSDEEQKYPQVRPITTWWRK